MRPANWQPLNPVTLGMTLFFTMIAMTLLLIRVIVEAGSSGLALAHTPGLALIASGLAGFSVLAGTERPIQQPEVSGLPARV